MIRLIAAGLALLGLASACGGNTEEAARPATTGSAYTTAGSACTMTSAVPRKRSTPTAARRCPLSTTPADQARAVPVAPVG